MRYLLVIEDDMDEAQVAQKAEEVFERLVTVIPE